MSRKKMMMLGFMAGALLTLGISAHAALLEAKLPRPQQTPSLSVR